MNSAGKLALAAFAGLAVVGLALYALHTPGEDNGVGGAPRFQSSSSDANIESPSDVSGQSHVPALSSSAAMIGDPATPERETVAPSDAPPVFHDTPIAPVSLPSDPPPFVGIPTAGVVIDNAGNGVPGVKVWIERYCMDPSIPEEQLLANWKDLSTAGNDPIERQAMLLPHLAETDASGVFTLPNFPPGRIFVKAVRSGLQLDLESSPVATVGESIRFRATRKIDLTVSVKHVQGDVPSKARIRLKRGDVVSEEYWIANDPTLSLAEGTYTVSAFIDERGSDAGLESKPTEVEVREGAGPIELVLGEQGSIWVKLYGIDSHEAYCVASGVIADGASPEDVRAMVRERGSRGAEMGWGSSEGYRFQSLEPGRYDVLVFPFERSPYFVRKSCEVKSTREEIAFRFEDIRPPLGFHCRIEDRTAAPEAMDGYRQPFEFRVRAQFGGESIHVPVEVICPPDNKEAWLVPSIATWAELSPGRTPDSFTVWAHAETYGSGESAVAVGQQEVTISIAESKPLTKTLTVVIRGVDQAQSPMLSLGFKPLAGARGTPTFQSPSYASVVSATSPTQVELEVGTYEVRLFLAVDAEDSEWSILGRTQVDLETTTRVDFVVPELCRLYLTFTGATREITARLTPLDSDSFGSRKQSCAANERMEIEGLPAGGWAIEVTTLGPRGELLMGFATVTVPMDTRCHIDLLEPNCVEVDVTDPEGLLGKAGFHDGDRVVAIDGVRIAAGLSQALGVLSRIAKEKSHLLTVDRAGVEVTIEWKLPSGPERGSMGGSMRMSRSP